MSKIKQMMIEGLSLRTGQAGDGEIMRAGKNGSSRDTIKTGIISVPYLSMPIIDI
ncbi:MAG: hypothetical protein U9O97_05960 [Elusimicrobiota bacterium]|nr:hypothetical protein [Elusimicrobiota bacterium]